MRNDSLGKRISCVECRQQKAKCNAHETAPGPCSRCARRGITCILNPTYRRKFKRREIALKERDYELLKMKLKESQLGGLSGADQYGSTSSLGGGGESSVGPSPRPQTATPSEDLIPPTPPKIEADLSPAISTKTLGDIVLTPQQTTALFKHFVQYYQPQLPLVNVSYGIEKIYRLCPILFWTIMFTALRGYESPQVSKDQALKLYFALSPVLKSALAELSIAPITRYAPSELDEPVLNVCSVYSVQAFLLYTFWPPITSSVSADSSWYTIGIAMCQAIRIGLHLPGHSTDELRTQNPALLAEQARTWTATNVISQAVATAFGFPTLASPMMLTGSTHDELNQLLEIQVFERQVADTLNGSDGGGRLPMLKLLETELVQLEKKFSELRGFKKLCLLAARLHLLTYHFLGTPTSSFDLSAGLLKAYDAACKYIRHCARCQTQNPTFASHLPTIYTLTVWQAATIVARVVHSPSQSLIDVMEGRNVFQAAVTFARQASIIKHDMAYRSSGIMLSTWTLFKTLHEKGQLSPKVTISSRMSASVFFDSLWLVRQKCGMVQLAPRTQQVDESLPETDARKIISTVPLDPQPIPLSGAESSPSSQGSPTFFYKPHQPAPQSAPPPQQQQQQHQHQQPPQQQQTVQSPAAQRLGTQGLQSAQNGVRNESTVAAIASPGNLKFLLDEKSPISPVDWETEVDSELLFKDIDSVMNNFGFHTEK